MFIKGVKRDSKKSSAAYDKAYTSLKSWMQVSGIERLDENALLAYFKNHLNEKNRAPSSMWPLWSMLKERLQKHDNINIENWNNLKQFIKEGNMGYTPKKSEIISVQQLFEFLTRAPDETYLTQKVEYSFSLQIV